MSLVWKDRVEETTSSTGTFDFLLDGPSDNFQPFSSLDDGDECEYGVVTGAFVAGEMVGTAWEVGSGTYDSGANVLSRDTVYDGSSGPGAKISLTGQSVVFITIAALRVASLANLGTGVATFLATPTSANLAAALTDETGSGAAVFANSPSLITPDLGIPSAIDLTNATNFPGGSGTPGGADKTIQYNDSGAFGGIGPLTNGQLLVGSSGATAVAASLTAPAAGITITGGVGTITFALANDLASLEAMSGTGLVARTASETYAQRTLTAPAAGITVSNGDGVAGNPSLVLANDLAALEGLSSTGLAARTTTDTWAQRTITGTANRITLTNGDGVSGNPTIDIHTSYVGQNTITTLGTIGTGTWAGTTIAVDHGGTGQTSYTDGQVLIGNTIGNTLGKATITAGSGISVTNGASSITIAATGTGLAATTQIDTYLTNSGSPFSWAKPSGAKSIEVIVYGSGGGGGAGQGAATNNQRVGGSGGGGGCCQTRAFNAADITSPVSITVAAGGTGGTASGANGTAGGTSSFGSYLSAGGGGRGVVDTGGGVRSGGGGGGSAGDGVGGSTSAVLGGLPQTVATAIGIAGQGGSAGGSGGLSGEWGGGGGGHVPAAAGGASTAGGQSLYGSGGGGGGGGITSGNTTRASGAGGGVRSMSSTAAPGGGGAPGTTGTGNAGDPGVDGNSSKGGEGGGGGACNAAGTGGKGGNGGSHGGGGGGGGGGTSTQGNGGDGGAGAVYVITHF